jgi:Protein of unknown function (DUF3443)/IPT/TIG domain
MMPKWFAPRPSRVSLTTLVTASIALAGACSPTGCQKPLVNNVIPIHVGSSAFPGFAGMNKPYVALTICVPGGTAADCQTVDDILLDTGSVGLHIFASALTISLPPQSAGSNATLDQCQVFGAGSAWGPVASAAVTLGNEAPVTVPIQIINPPGVPPVPVPSRCSFVPGLPGTAAAGVNGVLGVAPLAHDIDSGLIDVTYFSCAGTTCTEMSTVQPAQAVQNPVYALARDNNGIIVHLDPIGDSGAVNVGGSLILGINTAAPVNDPIALSGGTPIRIADTSSFSTPFGIMGATGNGSFGTVVVDTGSNAVFFVDSSLTTCSGSTPSLFFCPSAIPAPSRTFLVGSGASSIPPSAPNVPVTTRVGNAGTLLASGNVAFSNLAGTFPGFTLFGAPFFYGKYVYIMYGAATVGTAQWQFPMWAYSGSSVAPPTIATVAPPAGPAGVPVILSGYTFGATQGTSFVMFGTTRATVTSWSDVKIETSVPAGLATGPTTVTVVVNGQTSPAVPFNILP